MKAAVLGSPISHSKSPDLHLAAYQALGLDWTYERIECTAEQLPGLVASLGPEWVGLSVTMPGKVAALEFATERTERAELAGSANTLVRIDGGWRADCTDIDGVAGALTGGGIGDLEGLSAVVLGAGGTARPALIALSGLGVSNVTVVARDRSRAAETVELAESLAMAASWQDFEPEGLGFTCSSAAVVVSTIPASAAAAVASHAAQCPFLLDAIYNPWPTPLAEAFSRAGGTVVSGLEMLLNQAYSQVEQFTGMAAPKEAMNAAIRT